MGEPLRLSYWAWSLSDSGCVGIDRGGAATAPAPLEWQAPPAELHLKRDDVHVWRVNLTLAPLPYLALRQTLSADELARAKRFVREGDRQHFIVARGALRDIVARYLRAQPGQIRFRYDAHGKPSLEESCGATQGSASELQFNLSHTDGLALVAIASGRRVGVDAERIRSGISQDMIARSFSPQEQQVLRSLPAHLQALGFFNCWTRKEAYLKARGEGLTLSMDSFDVSLDPGAPVRLLNVRGDADEPARWMIVELPPGPGHVAALAAERLLEGELACTATLDDFCGCFSAR